MHGIRSEFLADVAKPLFLCHLCLTEYHRAIKQMIEKMYVGKIKTKNHGGALC